MEAQYLLSLPNFIEIPVASSTMLDVSLSEGRSRSAVQKIRQELRQSLGLGRSLSLGRYGTVRMENVALLPCLETAGRWARTQVNRLIATYQAAGLGDLVSSGPYGEMLELTGDALREEARQANGNKAILVAHAIARLAVESPVVREVARAMSEINAEVDRRLPEFRRLPGRLVRVEGADALIVIDTGEHEELTTVDAEYLFAAGISEAGEPFIRQELSWSPDTLAWVYVPAIDLGDQIPRSQWAEELATAESPLPRPN